MKVPSSRHRRTIAKLRYQLDIYKRAYIATTKHRRTVDDIDAINQANDLLKVEDIIVD